MAVVERPRRILDVQRGGDIVLATLRLANGPPLARLELEEAARGDARMRCPGATLVRGDACGLPFGNQSFHLGMCPGVAAPLPDAARPRTGASGLFGSGSSSF